MDIRYAMDNYESPEVEQYNALQSKRFNEAIKEQREQRIAAHEEKTNGMDRISQR